MNGLIEVIPPSISENVSPGVTPGIVFSRSGTVTTGAYFKVGDVITSNCGQPIFGKNKVVKLRATTAETVGLATVIKLQRRTGVASFADIDGAEITIPAGHYTATAEISVPLPNDPEIACYVASGSNLSSPVVIVFLFPDYS